MSCLRLAGSFLVVATLASVTSRPLLAQSQPPGGSGSQQGRWEVQYTSNGTSITSWASGSVSTPWNPQGSNVLSQQTSFPNWRRINNDGTVRAVLIWRLFFPGAQPPKTVYVLENAGAGWQASGPSISGFASSGLDPEVPILGGFGRTIGGTSSGSRLRQYDGSSGRIEIASPCLTSLAYAHAEASNTVGSLSAGCSFSVVQDNRGVILESPAIELDGINWGRENDLPVRNKRNSDGSITVDSVAAWSDAIASTTNPVTGVTVPGSPAGWNIFADMVAKPVGFSTGLLDSRVDWSEEGEGWIDNNWLSKWNNQLRGGLYPQEFNTSQPWPKGKTSTVKVKVQDLRPNLQATAENSHTIRWHAPFENWRAIDVEKPCDRYIPADILTSHNGVNSVAQFQWYDEDASIAAYAMWEALSIVLGGAGDAGTAGMPDGFGTTPGMVSSLLGYLGVLVDNLRPKPYVSWASTRDLWNDPRSTPKTGRTEQLYNDGRFNLNAIQVIIRYGVAPYKAHQYAVNGYQGLTVPKAVARKKAGQPIFVGDFTIIPIGQRL